MSQAFAHLGCSTIAEAQAETPVGWRDLAATPQSLSLVLACTAQSMQMEWAAIQNVNTPILTDRLMNLMPLFTPTTSNKADWCEV